MIFSTQTLDMVYLEYSNITDAKTRKELELAKELETLREQLEILKVSITRGASESLLKSQELESLRAELAAAKLSSAAEMAKKDEELAACKRNNKNLIEEHSTRAALEKRIKELEESGFHLSAYQCIHPEALTVREGQDGVSCAKEEYITKLEQAVVGLYGFIEKLNGKEHHDGNGGLNHKAFEYWCAYERGEEILGNLDKHTKLIEQIKQKRGKV